MRLICPNCDAEYEVDAAAIPREGRDVQCSACGHAWFQLHPEVEAEKEAEAELYEAPEGAAPAAAAAPEPDVALEVEDDDADELPPDAPAEPAPPEAPLVEDAIELPPPAAPVAAPTPAARGLDETVLAVLKEEAEREAAARRAETQGRPSLESQTEMPLSDAPAPARVPAVAAQGSMAAAVKRIAKLRGMAPEAEEAAEDAAVQKAPEAAKPAKSRRKDFPAIEEINQSLRASGERGMDGEDAVAETLSEAGAAGGGFRRGVVLLVALAALIVVLYTFAPVIGAKVPALQGAAAAYVAAVDAARIWLDETLRGLIGWLQGLSGEEG